MDERDEEQAPEAQEPITERVRIIGAEPAAVLAGDQAPAEGSTAGEPDGREQRYLGFVHHATPSSPHPEPPPPPDTSHLAAVSPELPHWSDPPTGQVPAVIDRRVEDGDNPEWSALSDSGPVWREHEHEWEDTGGYEPAMLADDQTRVGALDETPVEERRPWEFDDLGSTEAAEDDAQPGEGSPGAAPNPAVERGPGGGPDDLTAEQPVVRSAWDEDPSAPGSLEGSLGGAGEDHAVAVGDAAGRSGSSSWWDEDGEGGGRAGEATGYAPPSDLTDPSVTTMATGSAGPSGSDALSPSSAATTAWPAAGPVVAPGDEDADQGAGAETLVAPGGAEGSSSAAGEVPGVAEPRGLAPTGPAIPIRPRRTISPSVGPAPAAGGRRDVPLAVATGVGIAAVFLACLYWGSLATVVLATVVFTVGAAEVYAALRRAGRRPATLLGLVATIALMASAYSKGVAALPLVSALLVMTAMAWYLVGADRSSAVDGISSTLLGFGWVAVLGSFAALLVAPSIYPHRHGLAFALGAVVATVAADVGALVVGSWLGRHQLAPHVSPNKTWEGWVGGAVLAVAASVAITGHVHPWTPAKAAVLGVVIAVLAPIGDLCESLVKRDLGVKDLGSLLPGHGGVIDRVDGLLFALPATYYLVRLLHLG